MGGCVCAIPPSLALTCSRHYVSVISASWCPLGPRLLCVAWGRLPASSFPGTEGARPQPGHLLTGRGQLKGVVRPFQAPCQCQVLRLLGAQIKVFLAQHTLHVGSLAPRTVPGSSPPKHTKTSKCKGPEQSGLASSSQPRVAACVPGGRTQLWPWRSSERHLGPGGPVWAPGSPLGQGALGGQVRLGWQGWRE